MKPMRRNTPGAIGIILLLVAAFLAGCQTMQDQYEFSGFVWYETVVEGHYQDVQRRIAYGFVQCPDAGMAESIDFSGSGTDAVRMEVYQRTFIHDRTDLQLGIIQIRQMEGNRTHLRVGVRSDFDKPVTGGRGYYSSMWMQFAEGYYSCVQE